MIHVCPGRSGGPKSRSIYGETEVTLVRTQLGLDSGSEPLVSVAKVGGVGRFKHFPFSDGFSAQEQLRSSFRKRGWLLV